VGKRRRVISAQSALISETAIIARIAVRTAQWRRKNENATRRKSYEKERAGQVASAMERIPFEGLIKGPG
jgi:hypothetical protein